MTRWIIIVGLCGIGLACGRTGVFEDTRLSGPQTDAGVSVDSSELTGLRACIYIGGQDRLRIFGQSVDPPGCAWMQFTSPGGDGYMHHVDIPHPWSLTFFGFLPGEACPVSSFTGNWRAPVAVEGAVHFADPLSQGGYPQRLDVDVLAQFKSEDGALDSVRFRKSGLEITANCAVP